MHITTQRQLISCIKNANKQVNVIRHDHKAIYRRKTAPFRGKANYHGGKSPRNLIGDQIAWPTLRILRRLDLLGNLRKGQEAGKPLERNHVEVGLLVIKALQPLHGGLLADNATQRGGWHNTLIRTAHSRSLIHFF